jgi:fluoride exporter
VPPLPALVLVAVGGAAGGLLREAVRVVADPQAGTWGWATLAVNAAGAFALTALLTVLARRPSERARLLAGTGLCGGLTTFSGLALEAVSLADAGRPAAAAAYVVVAVASLLGAAVLGARTATAVLASRRAT